MKVRIQSDGRDLCFLLPTRMIFSKGLLKFGIRMGKKYAGNDMPDIPPEAVDALCDEIRRIKKRYGSWELVDIQCADGDRVNVIL